MYKVIFLGQENNQEMWDDKFLHEEADLYGVCPDQLVLQVHS